MNTIEHIAVQFVPEGYPISSVVAYGSGNINDTYVVGTPHELMPRFILQRINQHVFRQPRLIMQNLRTLKAYAQDENAGEEFLRNWRLPEALQARNGQDYIEVDGEFWRALTFIEGAQTYDAVRNTQHARECGYALGRFQRFISQIPTDILADTLPGFHVMPSYLQHYDAVSPVADVDVHDPNTAYCLEFIQRHRVWARVLDRAVDEGTLVVRPIHGDPKINNIMIDDQTNLAVSIIDLDTVKPGLVQHDIGDCLRSSCNPLGEETDAFDDTYFDIDLCKSILEGYLPQVRAFYSQADYNAIYDAVRVLAFEMGLRFFTDYVEGDVYFKVRHRKNNLNRAVVQFRLAESIMAQQQAIEAVIQASL